MWDCVAMLVREKDPIGPFNVRASAVTAPSTAANSDLARPRDVAFGSRAAVVARLMVRPVCPQLRKCCVRLGSYTCAISGLRPDPPIIQRACGSKPQRLGKAGD